MSATEQASLGGRRIDRILIHGTNWIGDLVLISPGIRAIRKACPESRISLVVRAGYADALRPNPHLDEIIPYERNGRHRPPFGVFRFARELREKRFDLAVLFPKSFEVALIARLAGIPQRAGWRTDGRGLLITHGRRMRPEDKSRHNLLQFLEAVRFAGVKLPERPEIEFHLEEEDRASARSILGAAGVEDGELLVAVHPGASKEPRAWHPERFAAAADQILTQRHGKVLLLGGPSDRPLCAAVGSALEAAAVDLSGRTSIRVTAAILERVGLFLGNDSGLMHMAAAVGTPVAAVFGPGSPERTTPYVEPARVRAVTTGFSCSPCRQDFFRECVPGPEGKPYCLENLGPEEVAEAGLELIQHGWRGVVR
jgi:heptosyltransferase-2